jgi:MerR family transcriptional regulator/heat shock protein HspR
MARGRRTSGTVEGTEGARAAPGRGKYYMISVVAKSYGIHPQTLRLYEREGLLKPSRTEGNTRLYSEDDLRQLEVILNLTRDLGVNLAGVEIVLNMRRKMEQMQAEFGEFLQQLREELQKSRGEGLEEKIEQALVKLPPAYIVRPAGDRPPEKARRE